MLTYFLLTRIKTYHISSYQNQISNQIIFTSYQIISHQITSNQHIASHNLCTNFHAKQLQVCLHVTLCMWQWHVCDRQQHHQSPICKVRPSSRVKTHQAYTYRTRPQTDTDKHMQSHRCKHYLGNTFLCKHTCWTCTNICNHKCQACTNICNHKCWARNDKCKHICKEMWTQMWIYASINVIICNHKRFNTQGEM